MNLWCRRSLLFALLLFVFLVPVQATTLVTDIDGNAAAGDWYNGSSGGGSATLIDLTGLGGNLENNASLPNGVVKLTTGADNGDRGEIGMQGDFGLASVVLNDVAIGYDYYKENVGNPSAAPAIKLTLWGQGTGDNYGTLVYEPTWNQPGGGSSLVPTGDWQTVSINQATGNGDISSGGWWWTGGFENDNTAAGPPIRSLSEWATAFSIDPDFAAAHVIGINIGVGTYNQNQVGYFDNVSLFSATGGLDISYDFETAGATIPEPTTMVLFGFGLLGVAGISRRKVKA